MNYRQMLDEGFAEIRSFGEGSETRLEYLSSYIFDFTTYDLEMDELFAAKAVEVCTAITNRETFEYIKDPDNYRWFLLMCNMPFFADKLEWGTSIRGAWWGEPPNEKIKFSSSGLWLSGRQVCETMEFTRDEWQAFVAAVLEFARADQMNEQGA